MHLFQIDDSEDDDVIKRQRMGEGHNIIDRGSNSQQVQDDIINVYVPCTSSGMLSHCSSWAAGWAIEKS